VRADDDPHHGVQGGIDPQDPGVGPQHELDVLNWEEIGEPIASDGPHDFYAIVVTFTTGATVKVVVVISSQTCSGCAY
jgi:hypothetical protein